jgi:polyhydroxyalkanoate synthase subunit PhaC
MKWMISRNALPFLKNASNNWSPDLKTEADQLIEEISKYPQDQFTTALDAVALSQIQAFQAGVHAYHEHPYQRSLSQPTTVWSEGGSNLLDYGGPEDGPVVLCVPSLINKAYVLDLHEKRSLMRSLSQNGIRAFLLDWGDVSDEEKSMGLSDYIIGRLARCLDDVNLRTQGKASLLGYCMGGVLTTALACLQPDKISSLILLATPWDFHAGQAPLTQQALTAFRPQLENIIHKDRILPIDVLQTFFATIDPFRIPEKFIKFGLMKQDSKEAEAFVALEDWLNDGVPLGGRVAQECLFDWYLENSPQKGGWKIQGQIINPHNIKCPTLMFIPKNDLIVPPESALALGNAIPHSIIRMISTGHIGMVAGKNAMNFLYSPLSKWLLKKGK